MTPAIFDHRTGTLVLGDGRRFDCVCLPHRPPIFLDPTGQVNRGMPTSAWDVLAEDPPDVGYHAIPVYHGGGLSHHWEYVERDHLYWLEHGSRRGRKPAVDLEEAHQIKVDRFVHGWPVTKLSIGYGVSEPTIRGILRGRILWYA